MMARLPLYLYVSVYVVTCLIGAAFLLFSRTFVTLAQIFTGLHSFWLSPDAVLFDLILLFVAPALLVVGYELGLRTYRRTNVDVPRISPAPRYSVAVVAPWAVASVAALISLFRGGAFHNIAAWTDYRTWVYARWQLFDSLTFFEFANIYNFLPVTAILLLLRVFDGRLPRRWRIAVSLGVAATPVAVGVLLFQKKTLMIFIILFVLSLLIYRDVLHDMLPAVASRRASRLLVVTGAGAYALYCILVAAPSMSQTARAMASQPQWLRADKTGTGEPGAGEAKPPVAKKPGPETKPPEPKGAVENRPTPTVSAPTPPAPAPAPAPPESEPTIGATGKPISGENARTRFLRAATDKLLPGRWIGVPPGGTLVLSELSLGPTMVPYVMFGPFIRTSVPALMYPAVYPQRLSFYGLDAGLDLLGIGRMPRDNIYVHRLLWPTILGGSVMVPAQFALFSQIGLGGALLCSALTGYLMSAVWMRLLHCRLREIRAVACALMLVFAIYVAGDSLRNSLLSSYGVFWGWLLLTVWYGLRRVHLRKMSAVHAGA